jgi:surface antigen
MPGMSKRTLMLVSLAVAGLGVPALGLAAVTVERTGTARPYLQCVPYARQISGVRIYGDAHTWWGQAEGRFARGRVPKVGAVMAFEPSGNMRLGHVAAVSRIVDSRTVLLRHANWSPINGRRGQIEDNVRAVDVSENNDWSRVRVWYAPIQALGGTHWPVKGFIYNLPPGKGPKAARPARLAGETTAPSVAPGAKGRQPVAAKPALIAPDAAVDPIGAIIAAKARRAASAR